MSNSHRTYRYSFMRHHDTNRKYRSDSQTRPHHYQSRQEPGHKGNSRDSTKNTVSLTVYTWDAEVIVNRSYRRFCDAVDRYCHTLRINPLKGLDENMAKVAAELSRIEQDCLEQYRKLTVAGEQEIETGNLIAKTENMKTASVLAINWIQCLRNYDRRLLAVNALWEEQKVNDEQQHKFRTVTRHRLIKLATFAWVTLHGYVPGNKDLSRINTRPMRQKSTPQQGAPPSGTELDV